MSSEKLIRLLKEPEDRISFGEIRSYFASPFFSINGLLDRVNFLTDRSISNYSTYICEEVRRKTSSIINSTSVFDLDPVGNTGNNPVFYIPDPKHKRVFKGLSELQIGINALHIEEVPDGITPIALYICRDYQESLEYGPPMYHIERLYLQDKGGIECIFVEENSWSIIPEEDPEYYHEAVGSNTKILEVTLNEEAEIHEVLDRATSLTSLSCTINNTHISKQFTESLLGRDVTLSNFKLNSQGICTVTQLQDLLESKQLSQIKSLDLHIPFVCILEFIDLLDSIEFEHLKRLIIRESFSESGKEEVVSKLSDSEVIEQLDELKILSGLRLYGLGIS